MKLFQSTLIMASMAAFMTSTISTAQADKKNFRSGVYAGAEIGWLYEEHKYSESRTGVLLTPTVINQSSHKNNSSFLPGLFLGYRYFMNCYYLGFELSALVNSSKTSSKNFSDINTTAVTKQSLHGKYNIIPALAFGRTFQDRYGIYAKAGYDFGQYRYRITERSNGVVTNSKHSNKDFSRFLLGAGFEYAINCLWSARLEYNYSFAQSKAKLKMLAANATDGINDYKDGVKVSSSALKVGVFAKF